MADWIQSDGEIVDAPARVQAAAIRDRLLTSVELLDEHLRRIAETNPAVNAIVTLDVDRARDTAAAADRAAAQGRPIGALHGLPIAIKDTEDTAGLRTTYGSPILANNIPLRDALVVERVRAAGGVILGKTNVPELATGSHTVNPVFGATSNPYDLTRSAGGSSGGAAAALATGMTSLATGSDMGGSSRNPAAFCNVVGLRPSAGRVPSWPSANVWQTMLVNGPMARTVDDVALLLSVLSGEDSRVPISLPGNGAEFAGSLEAELSGLRVGWSRTLDGLDISAEVTAVLESEGRPGLAECGFALTDTEPPISQYDDVFRVLRGSDFAQAFGPMVDEHPTLVGQLVRENVEYGRTLTTDDLARAMARRTELYDRLRSVFDEVDVLAAPATAVAAFDANKPWVDDIDGIQQEDYLQWMRTAWRITPTGFTALSVPCGFTPDGLPVGLQLIAPPRAELLLLRVARAFEQRRPAWRRRPNLKAAAA
ncbi:MAG: amidase [Rhodoglobus sp.]